MSVNKVSLSLNELLASIADSLNEAQEELRSIQPYDEFGRPNTLYTLPYLDFDIKVDIQTSQNEYQTENQSLVSRRAQIAKIKMSPVNNQKLPSNTQRIVSSIKGRFVAIPPNENLPQIYLEGSIEDLKNNSYKIRVLVGNSAGEKISAAKVEINFVPEMSDTLKSIPKLESAELFTSAENDDLGFAETTFTIEQEDESKLIVFEINVGPISKFVSIK